LRNIFKEKDIKQEKIMANRTKASKRNKNKPVRNQQLIQDIKDEIALNQSEPT